MVIALILAVGCGRTQPVADSARVGTNTPGETTSQVAKIDAQRGPIERSRCVVGGTSGVPMPNDSLGLPLRLDDIRGFIVLVEPFADSVRILVEQDPRRSAGMPSALIAVPQSARVVQRVGHVASPSALALCQQVSVWFTARARPPWPAKATATAVVIERSYDVLH